MVLAFTLRLLVSSALLLATVAQVLQCRFPRVRYGRRLSIARSFYKIGDTVSFVCNTGYTLKGSSTSTCQADLRWSPPLPVCKKEVTCPQPPNIANGQHSAKSLDKFSRGLTVYYSCKDGYALVGNVSITCTEAGVWSKTLPRCEAIGCETPKVQNGNVYKPQSTYKAGETLHFDCDAGYAAEDNYEAQCQPGGTWDPPVLTCERIRPCPMPPRVRNGNHNGQGKAAFTMGMSVTYTCDPGYYLVGNAVVFCKASGNWSQPGPHCEEVTCPQPPNIANGQHSAKSLDKFSRGLTVYYSCKDGYALVGNVSITCTEAGVWSKTLPHCEAIGCEIPKVQNGKVHGLQSTYKAGETLHFDCDAGYAAEDNYEAQCQPGGTWDPPVLTCERIRPCPMPPRVRNGNHNGQGKAFFTMGMSVTYTCDPGYYLVGNAVVFCKASGNWSQPGPRCEDIENGRQVDGQGLISTPGQAVTFQCDNGFSLQGSAKVFCQEDGSWLPPVPICNRLYHYQELSNRPEFQGIPCGPPPDIPNGKHTGRLLDEYHFGISVTYTCNPGYPLHGEPSIYCTTQDGKNGVWSSPLPHCGAGCDAPTSLAFAELKEPYSNQTVFPVGRTVEYVCRPGYAQHLGMPPTITCLGNRTWSAALEFCKRKQCANPGDPKNGRAVVLTDLLFESKVNYTCDKGYKLVGRSQRTCEVSGTRVSWSGDAPVCQGILCDPPPDIPHGRHSGHLMGTFSYADVVTYTCEPGHPLAGEPSIFCTTVDGEHGVWSGPPPRCGEVKCPQPPGIANGKHSGQPSDTHLPGSAVQYSCRDGYSLVGNASISCTAEGTWSRPRPRCEAIGCKRPEIENGRVNGLETMYKLADIVIFECNFGYALKGSQESQCQFGGTWDPPVPICEKMLECPSPPNINNGHHDSKDVKVFIPGISVKYYCDPGYVLTGKTTVSCLTSGTWSIPYPRCEVITCMSPNIQNGEVAEGQRAEYHPGANVTFQCHPGYVLWGSRGAKCQPNGRWAPAVPTCKPGILCDPPPDIPHGRHSGHLMGTFSYADVVTYTCEPGHPLAGEPSIFCTTVDGEHGVWSGPPPRCGGRLCPSPSAIDHGQHDGEDVKVFIPGTSVNYSCDLGYALIGETTLYCTVNGTWSIPYPRCEVITCMSPNIQNGEVAEGQRAEYHPGANVTFQCHPGYVLWGSRGAKCQPNGRWAPAVPTCKPGILCDPPPDIPHGRHSGHLMGTFSYADVVTYTCEPGHPLAGEPSIFCTTVDGEHGVWSGPPPRCGGRLCPSPSAIDHGQHDGEDVKVFIPGTSVNYSCDLGYALIGETTLYCTVNGTWSIPYPRCEVITCMSPNIQNGEVAEGQRAEYHPGANVTFQCHPGYVLWGSRGAKCQPNGRWAPAVPTCKPVVQCPSPPNIDKGDHNSHDLEVFSPGMVVNYSCDPGYSLLGEAAIYCTDSGNWSLPLPQCAGGCGAPPNLTFAELTKEYKNLMEFSVGDTVQYRCQPGYMRHPGVTPTLTCLKNHTWSEALAFCKSE
ncbi:complement receptor type 1 [Grus japonensis]|uniref:Complement receptor type 1 n=1 Tax=Grus japonensis TaxID=30415 RepID=A0ABC9XQN6_GRUJA